MSSSRSPSFLTLSLLCYSPVGRGEPSVANLRWGRPRVPSSPCVQRGKPTAASRTTSAPRRRFPSAQELPSRAANATRVLLPFVPLLAELPALTAHARAAWPWARVTVATAAAAAFSRWPLAYTSPLTLCRPLQQQQQHAVTPRNRVCLICNESRRIQRENYAHRSTPMVGITAGGFPCYSTLGGDYGGGSNNNGNGGRCSGDQTPTNPVSSSTFPSPPPLSHVPSLPSSRNNDEASPLTRLGAMKETLSWATRWVAGAAVAGSALAGSWPAAVYADGVGGERGGEGGSGCEGGEGFGSKAFTKKSYDGFADGYDGLDGGWAASAIGTEVRQATCARRIASRASPWRIQVHRVSVNLQPTSRRRRFLKSRYRASPRSLLNCAGV